jgi:hypothetical protein
MGSDMMIAMCEYPKDFDQVRRRIDNLDEVKLLEVGDIFWGENSSPEDARNFLHEAVDLLASPPRDISTHEIEGKEWAFTGGMSSGDSPSESYDYIQALAYLDITYTVDPTGRRL